MMTKIITAQKIITMEADRPEATHVAVKDGRILAVGGQEITEQFREYPIEDFGHKILFPGFVEGHAHLMAGAMWEYTYCGYHDRIDPEGEHWPGLQTKYNVVYALQKAADRVPSNAPIVGWGYDPIFMDSEGLNRDILDKIAIDRPIAIIYSNFHAMCVNTCALDLVDYTSDMDLEGLGEDDNGELTGELFEVAAMFPILRRLGIDFANLCKKKTSVYNFAKIAQRVGVTTMADLFSGATEDELDNLKSYVEQDDYPLRVSVAMGALGASPKKISDRAKALAKKDSEKLKLSSVKLMIDGSIQAYTARLRKPGYMDGRPNGIWNTPPELVFALCEEMQKSGIKMHIHVNGDEAAEVTLNALEMAIKKYPDHNKIHVLQHCQLMDKGLFERSAALGVAVNIFVNHIWYFGDQHAANTIGSEWASRMDGCRSAIDAGAKIALHSDAPVTPLDPLFTVWCAVNRKTMTDEVLGRDECISVNEALHAVTLGAAYTLDMDDDVGSIAKGKFADFAVLDANPFDVNPETIKDIQVLGTIHNGETFLL